MVKYAIVAILVGFIGWSVYALREPACIVHWWVFGQELAPKC